MALTIDAVDVKTDPTHRFVTDANITQWNKTNTGGVGTSGFSGINGSSGYSGFSGYKGADGYSGYSGAIGQSGFSGQKGDKGDAGSGTASNILFQSTDTIVPSFYIYGDKYFPSGAGSEPDPVIFMGTNIKKDGTSLEPTKAAWVYSHEHNYLSEGKWQGEWHLIFNYPNGGAVRTISINPTFDKTGIHTFLTTTKLNLKDIAGNDYLTASIDGVTTQGFYGNGFYVNFRKAVSVTDDALHIGKEFADKSTKIQFGQNQLQNINFDTSGNLVVTINGVTKSYQPI